MIDLIALTLPNINLARAPLNRWFASQVANHNKIVHASLNGVQTLLRPAVLLKGQTGSEWKCEYSQQA